MAAVHNPPVPMRVFARRQTRTLLRRVANQLNRASQPAGPEAVHDLRVAIRRFSRCLRLFSQFLPRGKAKRVRRQLRDVMDLAAAVRDRDIALELLKQARVPARASLAVTLRRERREAGLKLRAAARRLGQRDFSRKCRAWLRL